MINLTGKRKKIHFVGIGGIGMSAIAHVVLDMGHDITGSDIQANHLTKKLEAEGGRVFEGHRASNLPPDIDIVVYSSSISNDNPEMKEALRRGARIMHRAQMLGCLFNGKKGIAVSGTHGKTTTTSLIAVMFEKAGLDPTAIIGGEVSVFNGNAKLGRKEYVIVEADESDSSFLNLKPFYAIITNIEMEHLDHFRSLDHIRSSFRAFINNLKPGGCVFYNIEDLNSRIVLNGFRKQAESFGFSIDADMYPVDIRMEGFKTSFKCVYKNNVLGAVSLSIPGRHNILNAMAAILVGLKSGISFKEAVRAIKDFDGVKRRFQLRADCGGVMLIDDYAHHPTEIKAVLDACRTWKGRRIIAVFQPHRYTRTKLLADEFGKCFGGVDKLILSDIYAASEKAIKGVSVLNILERVRSSELDDVLVMDKRKIPEYLMRIKRKGDIILILGAGDIKVVADRLAEMMTAEPGDTRKFSLAGNLVKETKSFIKGRVKPDEELSRHTSFKIGGRAALWVEPKDADDLKKILVFAKNRKIPLFVIGNGSNVLASDNGFDGIVICLNSPAFKTLSFRGRRAFVGAGYSLPMLVRISCSKSLAGLESLIGIPGTVGGAIYMNAGGYNNPVYRNIGEIVESVKVMDFDGTPRVIGKKDLKFGYRCSNLDKYVILAAELKFYKGDKKNLLAACAKFLKIKMEKQVLDKPSAGCIFKNPDNFQFTCGQMIDMLHLKGKKVGGAQISEKHANFIINNGGATCKDVLELAAIVKESVKKNYGIDLEMEVKVI
ncbi:MAG: UDP-N-acetylmuramate--L-alanine ligase [Candidatus Omnitrophica bacterium]|nr:UDP-N-acetylmuramate--L-alanine ligase [Candidatus Omnitrophota bacterium]MCM8790699.1 UDP-N-acetylmuramate--L-alanine ligase [Candidatus Omnitrophota bacterium]